MKALAFEGPRRIELSRVPDPEIQEPTDALVEVRLAGICGSDLHLYHEREKGLDLGTAMGHEFVGEVIETGSAVRNFTKGSRVVSPFTTSCGSG